MPEFFSCKDITNRSDENFAGYCILEGMGDNWIEPIKKDDVPGYNVVLTVNGVEYPFRSFLDKIGAKLEDHITHEAGILSRQKFATLDEEINKLRDSIRSVSYQVENSFVSAVVPVKIKETK